MGADKIESMLKTWMKNGNNPIINHLLPLTLDTGLLTEIERYVQNCNLTK